MTLEESTMDFVESLDIPGRVRRNPYGTILAAAGAGYVLGGGLFSPLTARIIRFGIRIATLPILRDKLLNAAQSVLEGLPKPPVHRP